MATVDKIASYSPTRIAQIPAAPSKKNGRPTIANEIPAPISTFRFTVDPKFTREDNI
jgi:hypothetical protein